MILPGFFIEYLVIGSCGLLWIFGLFRLFDQSTVIELDAARIALLALILYVLGMLIDFCSRQPLMALRDYLKIKESTAESDRTFDASYAAVWARSADLGRQADIRRSRDRIARGATGNFLAATIVFTICAYRFHWVIPWGIVFGVGLVLTFTSACMWLRFDRLTSKFTRKAAKVLNEIRAEKAA